MTKQQIIQQLLPGAILSYEQFHILPSVSLSQAILETGWLRYCSGNNLFGIKWTKNCRYEFQELNTTEYIRGIKTPVKCKFRKYKSFEDSFIDHGELLYYSNRYKPVIKAEDYEEACYELYKCGYATDPKYAEKLIEIIESNQLYLYDKYIDNPINLNVLSNIASIKETISSLKLKDKKGIYGYITKTSIIRLKEILELEVNDTWDFDLDQIVNSILKKHTYSLSYPPSQEITRYIQYRVGAKIDGIFGQETDKKIREYQRKNNLEVDGWIGKKTWETLIK